MFAVKFWAEKHPDTAESYNDLGTCYCDFGWWEQGIENCTTSVNITKELLGIRHPDTITCVRNLSLALRDAGQRREAFTLLDEILRDLPRSNSRFEELAQFARNLLKGKPLRPGFRQPTAQQAERNWGKAK